MTKPLYGNERNLVKHRVFGDYEVGLFKFRDGYREYAARRVGNHWIESQATSYPQSKEDGIKSIKEYKNSEHIKLLHPALRGGYNPRTGRTLPP
jgi:hypothetical protein